jgi:hypothetical protein
MENVIVKYSVGTSVYKIEACPKEITFIPVEYTVEEWAVIGKAPPKEFKKETKYLIFYLVGQWWSPEEQLYSTYDECAQAIKLITEKNK